MKIKDRVRFTDKPFLSEGYILKIHDFGVVGVVYIIKLDEKAPDGYAWDTDEVVSFGGDLEVIL